MRVEWTDNALEQLWAIHEYYAVNSPEYAQRLVDRLLRRSQRIAQFPQAGRPVPEFETPRIREVFEGSYRIIYTVKSSDQIDVIAVLHGKQHLP